MKYSCAHTYLLSLSIVASAFVATGCSFGVVTKGAVPNASVEEEEFVDASRKNVAPDPTISIPSTFAEGQAITVRVFAHDPDSDKHTVLYDWDGDGTYDQKIDSTKAITHAWKANGNYKVRVMVQDDRGGIGKASARVEVTDTKPLARLKGVTQVEEGKIGSFDASISLGPVDPIIVYEWDFNYSGGTFRRSGVEGAKVEHRWMRNGVYRVAVRVKDRDGSTSVAIHTVQVLDQVPKAAIAGPKEIMINSRALFSASSSQSTIDKIVRYEWDMDHSGQYFKPSKLSRKSIRYRWRTPGTKTIAVRVTDADGSTNIATHKIVVKAPPPPPAAKKKVVSKKKSKTKPKSTSKKTSKGKK